MVEVSDDLEEKNLGELIEKFQDDNKLWRLEGDAGLDNFTKIVEKLGYKENNFKYGSPIEQFLSDNSGALEALLDWISDVADCDEWRARFTEETEDEDSEDDE